MNELLAGLEGLAAWQVLAVVAGVGLVEGTGVLGYVVPGLATLVAAGSLASAGVVPLPWLLAVAITSAVVGDSMQLMPAPARLFARTVLAKALADHAEQEAAVAASGLDWTVVRPGGLSDGPATGSYIAQETSEGRPMKGVITRADVATHIVRILDDSASFERALAMGTP